MNKKEFYEQIVYLLRSSDERNEPLSDWSVDPPLVQVYAFIIQWTILRLAKEQREKLAELEFLTFERTPFGVIEENYREEVLDIAGMQGKDFEPRTIEEARLKYAIEIGFNKIMSYSKQMSFRDWRSAVKNTDAYRVAEKRDLKYITRDCYEEGETNAILL